ncbi:unnamed protein product [Lepeophtheirus salmonis]|uniref:Glycerophosphocholine acyltransferase 1 n=1 Tax=Lepeophtheirus salmonis TaxID=72036 RepID=A0A7R8D162_LEPSM|nr:unnamed protein product [Lepeophtheirus salmonis]CAF2966598.1 unnamed protein product [Lepeophtheirus salmonis]
MKIIYNHLDFQIFKTSFDQLKNGLQDKSSKLFHSLKGKAFHLLEDLRVLIVMEMLKNLFKDVPAKAQRQFRAAVTGDPNNESVIILKKLLKLKFYCHLTRWSLINPDFLPSSLNFCTAFVYPLLTYLLWQALYVFLIEVSPLSRTLANDSELLTSYRYLSRDKKNSLNQLVAYLCAKWKIELPTTESGDIDPDAYRMKAVFFAAQFVYTFITLLYVWIVYTSYVLNCTYILIIFIWGTWNGASYYIEVFSKRYNLKFEVKEYEESVVYECDDGDSDEEFVEATEILNNEISSLSEYKDDVRIVDVNYDPNLSFKLSNNKDKFLSFNELRFEYPQLAITFLMSFPKEEQIIIPRRIHSLTNIS